MVLKIYGNDIFLSLCFSSGTFHLCNWHQYNVGTSSAIRTLKMQWSLHQSACITPQQEEEVRKKYSNPRNCLESGFLHSAMSFTNNVVIYLFLATKTSELFLMMILASWKVTLLHTHWMIERSLDYPKHGNFDDGCMAYLDYSSLNEENEPCCYCCKFYR